MVIPALTSAVYGTVLPLFQPVCGNAQNIIDAGGTGTDNTSIWLVVWRKHRAWHLPEREEVLASRWKIKAGDTGRCE